MTRLFHSDPHRGNLLRTRKGPIDVPGTGERGRLALGVIDFGMMVRICRMFDASSSRHKYCNPFALFLLSQSDIPESDRYGLIGLVLGLKNKDIALATENLLKVERATFLICNFLCCISHAQIFQSQCSLDFSKTQLKSMCWYRA